MGLTRRFMPSQILQAKVLKETPNITKTRIQLAAELGVGRRAVENYDRVARAFIPDYLELCRGKNGRIKKRLPLMPFQQHCLRLIAHEFKLTRSEDHVVRYIRLNPDRFSFSQYSRYL